MVAASTITETGSRADPTAALAASVRQLEMAPQARDALIRSRYSPGRNSMRQLARQFGLSHQLICEIVDPKRLAADDELALRWLKAGFFTDVWRTTRERTAIRDGERAFRKRVNLQRNHDDCDYHIECVEAQAEIARAMNVREMCIHAANDAGLRQREIAAIAQITQPRISKILRAGEASAG